MCNQRRTEPSLDELFGDFAMQLLMRRDGVTESDVRALLRKVKAIRAAVSVATKREPATETSSEADKIPLRFI